MLTIISAFLVFSGELLCLKMPFFCTFLPYISYKLGYGGFSVSHCCASFPREYAHNCALPNGARDWAKH